MAALPPKIKDIFTECDGFKLSHKPIVGVSANRAEGTSRVADAYINAVINAGGVPLLIPGFANLELLMQFAELCDGILLTGGGDISPDLLGEEASQRMLEPVSHTADLEEAGGSGHQDAGADEEHEAEHAPYEAVDRIVDLRDEFHSGPS